MKVYLAAAVPFERSQTPIPGFERIADQDKFHVHQLTEDPSEADLILFVDAHQHTDWTLKDLRRHPLTLAYPKKTLVYDERDWTWCALPGVYVSMPVATIDPKRQRAYGYYTIGNEMVRTSADARPDLLFSFMGAMSHGVRREIVKIIHPRAYIENTSHTDFFDYSATRNEERISQQKKKFSETVMRSKFVLCPRGQGASSIRLYEVMAAGRVPVIISDDWTAPSGPDWERCSLRLPEKDIARIPTLLEENEGRYEDMANQVRTAYGEWFAPEVMFHRLIELCRELLESGATQQQSTSNHRNAQYIRCWRWYTKVNLRRQAVGVKNRLIRRSAS